MEEFYKKYDFERNTKGMRINMSEKNITEEDKEKNITEILDIVKNNYNQYYARTQNIDNKSVFFIAFHGAVLLLLINPENINKILLTQYQNIEQILKYGFIVVLEISILILAISSICLFICSLKSRNIKYMPTNICEEKYYNCQNIDLNKELLKGYKQIAEYNECIIDKKHTLYNYASMITLIETILIGINLIIQSI